MPLIIAVWMFISFIYFKVSVDVAFYPSLSIIAAMLMAVMLGVLIFFLTGAYAIRLAARRVTNLVDGTPEKSVAPTILPMLIGSVAFVLLCRILVFGFSKKLNDEIGIFTGYRHELNGDFVKFAMIVVVPVVVHYCMVIFSQRIVGQR